MSAETQVTPEAKELPQEPPVSEISELPTPEEETEHIKEEGEPLGANFA